MSLFLYPKGGACVLENRGSATFLVICTTVEQTPNTKEKSRTMFGS